MEKLYKVISRDGKSLNDMKWGPGVTHTATGKLLSSAYVNRDHRDYLYAYRSKLVAAICYAVHVPVSVQEPLSDESPALWEAEGDMVDSDGLDARCTRLTTIAPTAMPEISMTARIRASMYLARLMPCDLRFVAFSDSWLAGKQRRSVFRADVTLEQIENEMVSAYGDEWHAIPHFASTDKGPAWQATIAAGKLALSYSEQTPQQQRFRRWEVELFTGAAFLAWKRMPVIEWATAEPLWKDAIRNAAQQAPWGVSPFDAVTMRRRGAEWAREMLEGFSLDKLIQCAIDDDAADGTAQVTLPSAANVSVVNERQQTA